MSDHVFLLLPVLQCLPNSFKVKAKVLTVFYKMFASFYHLQLSHSFASAMLGSLLIFGHTYSPARESFIYSFICLECLLSRELHSSLLHFFQEHINQGNVSFHSKEALHLQHLNQTEIYLFSCNSMIMVLLDGKWLSCVWQLLGPGSFHLWLCSLFRQASESSASS